MKKWVLPLIVACLGGLPLLEVASANQERFGKGVVVAASPVTQIPPTKEATAIASDTKLPAIILTQETNSDRQTATESTTLEEYIKQKQYEQALAFIDTIANADNKNSAAQSLAETSLQLGRYDIALQSSQKIPDLSLRVFNLRRLAQVHVAVGQHQSARAIVSQAFELSKKTNEPDLYSWVEDFLATGQEEQARTLINGLTGEEYHVAYARSAIAQAFLNLRRYTEAFEFAKRIPDRVLLPLTYYPDPKVELLESIIQKSSQAGQYDFAKQVALTLTVEKDQVKALQTIARQYAKNGKKEQAVEVLNQAFNIAKTIKAVSIIPDQHMFWNEPNAAILMSIADDYLELGQKQQAIEILDLATQSVQNFETQYSFDAPVWNKSRALRPLISSYLKLGEQSKAADLLALAFQEAQTLKGNHYIINELLEIATAYAELGNLQQGAEVLGKTLPLLETIEQKPEKIRRLIYLAKGFVAAGKQEQGIELLKTAMPLIETLEQEQGKIPLLTQSIGIYAAAGQDTVVSQLAARTLQMIQRLDPDYGKTAKLNELAVSSVQTDSPKLALEVVQNVPEPLDKTRMLLAIAQNYAQRGNTSLASEILAQAFAVADTIKDENQRNNVFASAARNLADLSNFPQNLTGETWRYNLAVQIAKPLSQPTTKAEILIQIALKYLVAGELEASRQTLANALEVAKGIEEQPQWRTKLLEMIEAGMKLEEYDFALQVANAIKDNASKTIVLRQVAQKYAIAGNKEKAVAVLSQAIQVANTIEDESARKQAIEGITQQQKE